MFTPHRKDEVCEKVGSVDSGSGEHTMKYEGYETATATKTFAE